MPHRRRTTRIFKDKVVAARRGDTALQASKKGSVPVHNFTCYNLSSKLSKQGLMATPARALEASLSARMIKMMFGHTDLANAVASFFFSQMKANGLQDSAS